MFTVGMPLAGQLFFMYNHVSRAYRRKSVQLDRHHVARSMTFETPMLFAIAFVVFTMGASRV